jgi:hypothetical protein
MSRSSFIPIIRSARRSSLDSASAGRVARSIDLLRADARPILFKTGITGLPVFADCLAQGGAGLIGGETLVHGQTLARVARGRHHVSGGPSTC